MDNTTNTLSQICMPNNLLILKFRKNDLSDDSSKQIEFSGAAAMNFFGVPADKDSVDCEFVYKAKNDYKKDKDGSPIHAQLKRSKRRKDYKVYGPNGNYAGSLKEFLLNDKGLDLCEQNNAYDFLVFYKTDESKFEFSYYPSDSMFVLCNEQKKSDNNNNSYNRIFYGAPGTGKSHEIQRVTREEAVIRTTFHPDSDYSTFVGSYKPTMKPKTGNSDQKPKTGDSDQEEIAYSFVKQAFLKAYLGAWEKYSEMGNGNGEPQKQYLVIEEINRGNCAQIFGDIFQLLDRSDSGFSTYPVEADDDIRKEIKKSFGPKGDYELKSSLKINAVVDGYTSCYPNSNLSSDVEDGRVLLLPPNLYIWATMNTSDQSLFPMDSAFKRRWEWKYFPIKENINQKWYISFGEKNNQKKCGWSSFLKEVNRRIGNLTGSEDKKIGFYFCKAKKNKIDSDAFVGKVLFYLYNDVLKVYDSKAFFKNDKNEDGNGEEPISFQSFYKEDGDIDANQVEAFLKKIGLAQAIESEICYTIDDETVVAEELIYKTLEKYIDQYNSESAEEIVEKWRTEVLSDLITTEETNDADYLVDGHGEPIYISKSILEGNDLTIFIQKVKRLGIEIKVSTEKKKNK